MTKSTHRRRFLSLLGAAGAVGFVGYSAAEERDDDHERENGDDEHHGANDDDEGDHVGEDHQDGGERHGDEHHEPEDGEFNRDDIGFMQMMIPHHEQAIEMAELVPGRTDRRELCGLAPEIVAVQEAEIEQMHEWLEEADVDAHDHEMDHHEMAGMVTPEEMEELRCAEGRAFDCLFVEHMIHHHEGAIVMAADALADGRSDRVAALAADVIEAQEAEIAEMEAWKREWGC